MARLVIETQGKDQRTLEELGRKVQNRIGANPMGVCPVDMLLNYVRVCHGQSCGKCVPCRIGLGQLAELLRQIRVGDAGLDAIDLLKETATVISETADCAIGYEGANLVLEGIEGFRADMQEHITNGKCLYGTEQAIPCTAACPAHVDVPGYIALTKEGRYVDAIQLIRKDNPFPAVCGYVCEHPCEKMCRRHIVDDGINICGIKRFSVDKTSGIETLPCAEATGKRVAVVGGGPGGLTAGYFLTLMGHEVMVYEMRDQLGGMLRYGIPDYRLPIDVLEKDLQYILDTGVNVTLNTNVGKDITMEELKESYDAVYISIGAHDDKKMGIAGEEAPNVVSAVKILREIGEGTIPDLKGKRVCVIGGGNVAMDATRTSLRLGASQVTCVYRRRIEDMTALTEEIQDAQVEGAKIRTLVAPEHIELDENGEAKALWVQPQIISTIGHDGRTSVRNATADAVSIACDYIIVAIGQSIHAKPFEEGGVYTSRGAIQAETSSFISGSGNVFAGGDAVSGPATVIRAVAAGKVAANNIDYFLGYHHTIQSDIEIPLPDLSHKQPCGRVELASRMIDEIAGDFDQVTEGMSQEGVEQECGRCLRCDHFGYGNFRGGRNMAW